MRPIRLGVVLSFLGFSALGADPVTRKLSVAQIAAEGTKLDGATIEVRGKANLSREISSFSDDSKCSDVRKPCKLSLAMGSCRVSGLKYAGLSCAEALLRLARDSGFPLPSPEPLVIANVVIVGRLSTSRESVRVGSQKQRPPAPGFGHFGMFAAELSATEINFDNAVVTPLQ